MATAGFKVINDNDILLVNESYMNFSLTRKVQVSTLPYWFADIKSGYMVDGSNYSCRKLILGSNEKIAFLGGVNGNGSLDGYSIKDYSSAYNGQNAYYILLRNGVSSSSLYMYVFGEANSVQDSSRYGLQIFDESNKLVFSSNKKPIRVLHYGTSNDGYTVDSTKIVAINVDNVYHAIPYNEIGNPNVPLFVDGVWAQEGTARELLMPYMSRYYKTSAPALINGIIQKREYNNEHPTYGLGNAPIDSWNGFVYMVIDVTNF